jgi:hypothetical protein
MRALLVCFCALILVTSVGLAQERVDAVYLKNGDVRKGTIIENVPNDYVKIETSDGSIFTIKYADIQKMTKEAKPAQSTQQSSFSQASGTGLMARTGDLGATAALWLGGDVDFGGPKITKQAGFLLRVFYDAYVAEKFSVGAYVSLSPISWENESTGTTMFEFGCTFKARFPLADGAAAIKPGIGFGYRTMSIDQLSMAGESTGINAMAVDASIEVQFKADYNFVPFAEIGFLSQPVGGNGDRDMTFPPFVYFGAGIAF